MLFQCVRPLYGEILILELEVLRDNLSLVAELQTETKTAYEMKDGQRNTFTVSGGLQGDSQQHRKHTEVMLRRRYISLDNYV